MSRDPMETMSRSERNATMRARHVEHLAQRREKQGKRFRGDKTRKVYSLAEFAGKLEDSMSSSCVNPARIVELREDADLFQVMRDNSSPAAHVALFVGLFGIAQRDGIELELTQHEQRALAY